MALEAANFLVVVRHIQNYVIHLQTLTPEHKSISPSILDVNFLLFCRKLETLGLQTATSLCLLSHCREVWVHIDTEITSLQCVEITEQ